VCCAESNLCWFAEKKAAVPTIIVIAKTMRAPNDKVFYDLIAIVIVTFD
jgi:hypothetical protein